MQMLQFHAQCRQQTKADANAGPLHTVNITLNTKHAYESLLGGGSDPCFHLFRHLRATSKVMYSMVTTSSTNLQKRGLTPTNTCQAPQGTSIASSQLFALE
jgi:hypothetical protein